MDARADPQTHWGLDWPLHTADGDLMWEGIRKELPQKAGLSIDDIERMLATLDPAVPRDARNAALLRVGYETGLRRSFLVALTCADVQWRPNGADVLVKRDKADQHGKGRIVVLSAEVAAGLRHWLELAGITEGALFRSTRRSNKPDRFARALRDREVARIYKRRAAAIGLDADEIAGHSTRIGPAQDMAADGESGVAICQQLGWKSESSLFRYIEHLEARRGAMPQFLKRRKQKKQNQQGG